MVEIHEGEYKNHLDGNTLVRKTVWAGYYWSNTINNAQEFTRNYVKCQEYAPVPYVLPEEMTSITTPWPFAQWGVTLVGPFPQEKCGVKYKIIAMDYFTKWAKAEPMVTITSKAVTRFL